ncbi:MAG: hypothetical protein DRG55_05645, partial [Deltaproteobacteria bacterium]
MGLREHLLEGALETGLLFLDVGILRGRLIRQMEKALWRSIVEHEKGALRPAQELKFYFVRNLLRTTDNHLRRGWLSR